jgi:hypothetical protein
MQKKIYILIFVCITVFSNAQKIKFDNYTTKDGLLSNEVYKIFQDNKGYIWLFTNYGAMKYNGKTFEPTLKNLPFNESFIYSYYENKKGQLWVANSNANIYEVINDSAVLIKGAEALSEKYNKHVYEIKQLFVDTYLNIYVSSSAGGYKLTKSNNYKVSNLAEYPDADSIYMYVLNIENEIIPASSIPFGRHFNPNKYYKFKSLYIDENNKDTYKIKFEGIGHSPPANFKRLNNYIYFSFYQSLLKFNKKGFVKYIPINSLVLHYAQDKRKHTWVATYNNGLFELNENDSIINHYLLGKTINHILIDSQDGLWVSTDGFGLFHCSNVNETHFNESESLSNPITFIKKIDDKLFLSNSLGEIYVIDDYKRIKIKQNNKDINDVLDIIKYNEGYLVCYRFHLSYLNLKGKVTNTKLPLINPPFHPLKLFNLGSDSILCMSRTNILKLKYGIKSIPKNNEIIFLNLKNYSFEIRNKIWLIATNKGVYQFINNKLIQSSYLEPTKDHVITKIVKDVLGNYWFCSKGSGLFKLTSNNKLTQYTIANNLPSNIIYDVSFNDDNSILLSTNKGLFYCDGLNSKLNKWNEKYLDEVKTAVSYHHTIYLATQHGLVTIKENSIKTNKLIYFNMTSLLVNGLIKNKSELSHLSYDQNNLECNVDIISYSMNIPKMMYELSGVKNQGGITENQHVSFQNLAVGNYTLTLSLISKEYNVKPIVLKFSIIPAYWQTVWFKSICIIAILISCFIIVRIAFRYYKNKEDKKNEANKLITEYKLIALKAQINPHFMSNCLTAIQHLILSNKVDEANQYLAKFSLLVRQVLNFSSKSLVSLREELEITELNIELEQLRFENKFLFEIELHENTNLKTIFVPPLILQPITENAIWHGLLPLKKLRKGILIIKIKIVDDLLCICIEDNGVGRKKENSTIGNMKESKGMLITKQRIENINVLYNTTKADLFYEDLIDDDHNPLGTRVTIILPLNLKTN